MPPTRSFRRKDLHRFSGKTENVQKKRQGIAKITAKDLKELGVIEWIVPEVEPAQKKNLETIAGNMKEHMLCFLENRKKKRRSVAIERYERFRRY